jgi:hypothetical protein
VFVKGKSKTNKDTIKTFAALSDANQAWGGKSAPGGTFPKPNATVTAPGATGAPTYYTAATAAYPTQSGTISECGNYYLVVAGDDCSTIDLRFGLNFSQLQEYNPYLNSTCGNLWLNYDICVAPVTPETVSTDGTCPPGVTCVESAFGDCCSPFGYCRTGSDYCVSSTNGTATQDGTCGPDYGGTTCVPQFGNCCSIYVSDAISNHDHPSYSLQSLILDTGLLRQWYYLLWCRKLLLWQL